MQMSMWRGAMSLYGIAVCAEDIAETFRHKWKVISPTLQLDLWSLYLNG